MKLIILPDSALREKANDVTFPISKEDKIAIKNMIEYIDSSQKKGSKLRTGIGIAAPQIGVSKRMFYVNTNEDDPTAKMREFLINPEIVAESQSWAALENGEGCLSIKENAEGTDGLVHRKFKIVMKGYSYFSKKEITLSKIGYHAIVLQHEHDHLNGILFVDKIDKNKKWAKKDNEILI